MTEHHDRRSDSARRQILRAAARLFARSSYDRVSLDDILTDAEVTKGAMYFHFRSKYALACAIVELRIDAAKTSIEEMLARQLSGLETLIDLSYRTAVDDIGNEAVRAGLNLLESIGRTDGLQSAVLDKWVAAIASLLISMYVGLRQTSDLDDPEHFLRGLQAAWSLLLPGLTAQDRVAYLTEFVKRHTAVAIKAAAPLG
ncbi:TetR/AcrR family transcriptional regulator [Mycolicibacterium sp. GF69]|uniref:TetR/AcrR family transcriptional regulator n=1 Tax=Mycolicibacterium sp. GF69 TaxID=2267251 RepID=UPI000DCAFD3A|nr:TetR/AcrR family transcriptional regulator [Mycolicibacterium sp. GF69]RAV14636.1 TetR/AcrR family transcriptional regulator [Mycolicibacterium sp. GF69]